MCGITAIALSDVQQEAALELIEATYTLQHRGQDSCGIATSLGDKQLFRRRGTGLVSEVFGGQFASSIQHLHGNIGIAHVRYSTTRSYTHLDAQPLHSPAVKDVLLAHNGNLTNRPELQVYLKKIAYLPTNEFSDSEHLLCVFSAALQDEYDDHEDVGIVENAFKAVEKVYELCVGSYACVAMLSGCIMGFRDPHGIKPLIYGERPSSTGGKDYMFSSESVTLEKLGFENLKDVRPGEAVLIGPSKNGMRITHRQIVRPLSYTPDLFEYVYFARPESIMDGINVHRARQQMGIALASAVKGRFPYWQSINASIDVVIPLPDTANTAALALAQHLKLPFSNGFVRNRYIFRTFIMPRKSPRMKGVWRKLTAIKDEFEGKNVLLVDDSIVRGNTAKEVVQMAREAGAKSVTLASCSPPIRYNHVHGIDLADPKQLVAHGKTEEQVRDILNCDELIYLPLKDLELSCLQTAKGSDVEGFEVGLFTGKYVTGALEDMRADSKVDKPAAVKVAEALCLGADCADPMVETFPPRLGDLNCASGRLVRDG